MTLKHSRASAPLLEPEEFIRLAEHALESSCRYEDLISDQELEALCRSELDRGQDATIEAALGALKMEEGNPAYEELLSMAEDCAQTHRDAKGVHALILLPLMLWSRYDIPMKKLSVATLKKIADTYRNHFCESDAIVTVGDTLLSAENLPESLANVRGLLMRLLTMQRQGQVVPIADLAHTPASHDLTDSRYLVMSVSHATDAGLFAARRLSYLDRAHRVMQFALSIHDILAPELIGCEFEVQTPACFFSAWRQNEAAMRVFAVRALVKFVSCMGFSTSEMIATSAVFVRATPSQGQEPNEEVRLSIAIRNDAERLVGGVVWPIMNEEPVAMQGFIRDILVSEGVTRVESLDSHFMMEWCEDCGAPLYATATGQVAHLELPEGMSDTSIAPTLN